jgi:hypothetical protein
VNLLTSTIAPVGLRETTICTKISDFCVQEFEKETAQGLRVAGTVFYSTTTKSYNRKGREQNPGRSQRHSL